LWALGSVARVARVVVLVGASPGMAFAAALADVRAGTAEAALGKRAAFGVLARVAEVARAGATLAPGFGRALAHRAAAGAALRRPVVALRRPVVALLRRPVIAVLRATDAGATRASGVADSGAPHA